MSDAIAVDQTEEGLSRKYRQPKGVEQYGIEAIPAELKTVGWRDLFLIIINFLMNPGMISIGGLAVVAGMSFWGAIGASVLGVLVAFSFYVALATIGVDYGLPGQVATRMTFGIWGAKWIPSLARALSSIYWFAFQTLIGAFGIAAILAALFGWQVNIVVVSVLFAIFQTFIAVIGYGSLKVLSRFAFPIKMLALIVIVIVLVTHNDPNFHVATVFGYQGTGASGMMALFIIWMISTMSGFLSMISDSSDFCRYSRSRADMWAATIVAACLGAFTSAFIGAYAAAGTLGQNSNAFAVMPAITNNAAILALVMLMLILDNWTVNVINLYSGGLSLSNMFSKVGRFWSTLVIAIFGIILSALPDLTTGGWFINVMSVMGNVFAPITGILLVDYFVFKRTLIDVKGLFDTNGAYRYNWNFNLVAVALCAGGFILDTLMPVTWVNHVVTIAVIGLLYYGIMKVVAARSQTYADAAKPGQQYTDISEEVPGAATVSKA
jgi:nucleobase:cation symporter-1, NCS1 family